MKPNENQPPPYLKPPKLLYNDQKTTQPEPEPNLEKSDVEKPSEKPNPKPNLEKTPTEPTVKPKPTQKTLFELMRKNENSCEEGKKTKPEPD